MERSTSQRVTLGIFVILGFISFTIALFFVGSRQNLFERNIYFFAEFPNVDGLIKGSSVWLAGVKIGTVTNVNINSRNRVGVTIKVQEAVQSYIKKDATAKISADGLIGNRIVVIEGGSLTAPPINENDTLNAEPAINYEDLFATFQESSGKLISIVDNLDNIFAQIEQGEGSLGKLIADNSLYDDLTSTLNSVSRNANTALRDVSQLVKKVSDGDNAVSSLINDTTYKDQLSRTMTNFEESSNELKSSISNLEGLTTSLQGVSRGLEDEDTPIGLLLSDTAVAADLSDLVKNLQQGTDELDETLEKAQRSFFFREKLFRKNKEYRKKNQKKNQEEEGN